MDILTWADIDRILSKTFKHDGYADYNCHCFSRWRFLWFSGSDKLCRDYGILCRSALLRWMCMLYGT